MLRDFQEKTLADAGDFLREAGPFGANDIRDENNDDKSKRNARDHRASLIWVSVKLQSTEITISNPKNANHPAADISAENGCLNQLLNVLPILVTPETE